MIRTRDTKSISRLHVAPAWSIASSEAIRPLIVAGKLSLSSLAIDTLQPAPFNRAPTNWERKPMLGTINRTFRYGLALAVTVFPFTAWAADPIGQVKTMAGPVTVERAGTTQPIAVGDHVFQSDVVITAAGGTVGIT